MTTPIYADLAIAGASVSHGHISSFKLSVFENILSVNEKLLDKNV